MGGGRPGQDWVMEEGTQGHPARPRGVPGGVETEARAAVKEGQRRGVAGSGHVARGALMVSLVPLSHPTPHACEGHQTHGLGLPRPSPRLGTGRAPALGSGGDIDKPSSCLAARAAAMPSWVLALRGSGAAPSSPAARGQVQRQQSSAAGLGTSPGGGTSDGGRDSVLYGDQSGRHTGVSPEQTGARGQPLGLQQEGGQGRRGRQAGGARGGALGLVWNKWETWQVLSRPFALSHRGATGPGQPDLVASSRRPGLGLGSSRAWSHPSQN